MSTHQLQLTVLGSSTPYPSVDNPCSGYLVESGSTSIWMDAGTGTLGPLQRHVGLEELDAIWISHLHADHSADLLTAFYALVFADVHRAAPLPLFGPPGTPPKTPAAPRPQLGPVASSSRTSVARSRRRMPPAVRPASTPARSRSRRPGRCSRSEGLARP